MTAGNPLLRPRLSKKYKYRGGGGAQKYPSNVLLIAVLIARSVEESIRVDFNGRRKAERRKGTAIVECFFAHGLERWKVRYLVGPASLHQFSKNTELNVALEQWRWN